MIKMGVAFDANNVVPKISSKKSMVKDMKKKKGIEVAEEDGVVKRKSEVISRLEDEAKFEAKQTFRFTPTQVIPVQNSARLLCYRVFFLTGPTLNLLSVGR